MDKKRLVMDVDTGIDDALALILALRAPEAEVLAIGTVVGNVGVERATENTLKVLDVVGSRVPVAQGLAKPLLRPAHLAPQVHGNDGMGDVGIPAPSGAATGEHAVDQLIRLAHERPGEITLFACGPLCNIGAALIREPELPRLLKDVVIMGGAVGVPGNVTSMAEANIYNDPEAARLVLAADWPLTMVGLDVTMETFLRRPQRDALERSDSPVAMFVARIIAYYWDWYTREQGQEGCALHDPLALGIALDPSFVTRMARLDVTVETESELTLGMTVADRRTLLGPGYARPQHPIDVPLAVDSARFVDRLMQAFLT